MDIKIAQLDRNTDGDIVTNIHWVATKTDGTYSASSYGMINIELGDTVIPFNELTEEVVKNWVAEKLDLVAVEASLDAQIEKQKAPKVASGLPWQQELI
jgi:hypothetical protein